MKQRFALFLTFLLFGTALTPALLAAADEPLVSAAGEQGVILSDGLGNPLSMSLQSTPSVLTVTPSAITLTSFDGPFRTDAMAFPLGISLEELTNQFADIYPEDFIGYDAQGNSYNLMPRAWSLEAVDTNTPGVYYALTVPNLGENYTLADELVLPHQQFAVSIQIPGELDINCCVSARGFLHFPWILSEEQQEQRNKFAVWLQQDGGEWTQLISTDFSVSPDYLHLPQRIFENGSTYNLKVIYPGGQTGVLTFVYDDELSIIDYSDGDRDGGDVNGGGSGAGSQPAPVPPQTPNDSHHSNDYYGDVNDNTNHSTLLLHNSLLSSAETSAEAVPAPEASQGELTPVFNDLEAEPIQLLTTLHKKQSSLPAAEQPKQAPAADKPSVIVLTAPLESSVPVPTKPSSSHQSENTLAAQGAQTPAVSQPEDSTNVLEYYSPLHTVISGLRLRDLSIDEESVVFGSGDLTASIPSKLLLALNLSDSDVLSVKLTQPESHQIMLTVEAAGKSVPELSGTVLRLRYKPQSKSAEITVQNAAGKQIPEAVFDGEFLRFPANASGTYTLLETSKAQETQNNVLPLLSLSAGLGLTAGGITLFRRKYHG